VTVEQKRGGLLKTIDQKQFRQSSSMLRVGVAFSSRAKRPGAPIQVGLLTGGDDKPYALGLTSGLVSHGIFVDFIGSDITDAPELHVSALVNFLNLRGSLEERVSIARKVVRISTYYCRLLRYAAITRAPILHILWNNKFELIDRIFLMLYYRFLGKKIVFTAHNVNAKKRDCRDSLLNRLSLRFQYRMSDHIFVHTERMKRELLADFGLTASRVTVIPFGINNVFPRSQITSLEARERLGVRAGEKTVLFFGQISRYKGLENLVGAVAEFARRGENLTLVIAGKIKQGDTSYWDEIQKEIARTGIRDQVIERIEFIPDAQVEWYFKAADVVILPYTHIFQSGLPFLAYSFGLPVIAADVGSLSEVIVEGKTGFVCKPKDPADLARSIEIYYASELYKNLAVRRREIQNFANENYSWNKVAETTRSVYGSVLAAR
jgi:glycosyltransferase involved in cell wall biosynthesis